MGHMNARDFFEQLRTVESDLRRYGDALDAAEERIEGLRSMGSSHGRGATDTDAIPRRIAQLEEARERYARAFDHLVEREDEAMEVIDRTGAPGAPNTGKWREALTYRYLRAFTWGETANRLGCGVRTAIAYADQALTWIDEHGLIGAR